MNATTTTSKGRLIRRLHTLRGVAGLTQSDYEALLDSYGAESSRDLTEPQLEALCRFLAGQTGGRQSKEDEGRKRLLAAVCRFCEGVVSGWSSMSDGERMDYAKGVACRAAGMSRYDGHGRDNFNHIGLDRMRSLAYAFSKRKRDIDGVVDAAMAIINPKK